MVENERARVLLDFRIQTDNQLPANQPDIVVINKKKKTAVVIDVAILADSYNIEKYQGLKGKM